MPFHILPAQFGAGLQLQTLGHLRFTAGVIQAAVAELLFACANWALSFSISFRRICLFTRRLRQVRSSASRRF